jgi:cysteine-rich CPXCG protein
MDSLEQETIVCPYCGESIDVLVDCSAGHQEYVEDCSVCCRPITIRIEIEDGDLVGVEARAENE